MRVIKFRWWDFAEEEMLSEYDLDNRIIDSGEDGYFHFMKVARYHPLQYTSIKDKNGVEIYEGDILKTPIGKIGQVFFHANGGWLVETKEYEYNLFKITATRQSEVIGNIYEHPHLLEVSTE